MITGGLPPTIKHDWSIGELPHPLYQISGKASTIELVKALGSIDLPGTLQNLLDWFNRDCNSHIFVDVYEDMYMDGWMDRFCPFPAGPGHSRASKTQRSAQGDHLFCTRPRFHLGLPGVGPGKLL